MNPTLIVIERVFTPLERLLLMEPNYLLKHRQEWKRTVVKLSRT